MPLISNNLYKYIYIQATHKTFEQCINISIECLSRETTQTKKIPQQNPPNSALFLSLVSLDTLSTVYFHDSIGVICKSMQSSFWEMLTPAWMYFSSDYTPNVCDRIYTRSFSRECCNHESTHFWGKIYLSCKIRILKWMFIPSINQENTKNMQCSWTPTNQQLFLKKRTT